MRPPALLLAALAWNARAAIPTATLKLEGGATLAVAPAALGSLLPPSKAQALHVTLRWAGGNRMAARPKCRRGGASVRRGRRRRVGRAIAELHL